MMKHKKTYIKPKLTVLGKVPEAMMQADPVVQAARFPGQLKQLSDALPQAAMDDHAEVEFLAPDSPRDG
jgi:hypothetical protein